MSKEDDMPKTRAADSSAAQAPTAPASGAAPEAPRPRVGSPAPASVTGTPSRLTPKFSGKTPRRVALYLRVSTTEQTTENQERDLRRVAENAGWDVVSVFRDEGISGARGRDKRPAFDALLKGATRREFDMVASWSVDRLGRSLQDLVAFLGEIHEAGVDLYLHQQAIDTSTPSGRAMFQLMGIFAEFERAMIVERVRSGMARAKARGQKFGRPPISLEKQEAIRLMLRGGAGILKTARLNGVGALTVQRIKAEMDADGRAPTPT